MRSAFRKAWMVLPLLVLIGVAPRLFGQISGADLGIGPVGLEAVVPDGYVDLSTGTGDDGPFPGCRPTPVTNPAGNPVMRGPVRLYYVWYGAWGANTARDILNDFADNLGGSPYYNINTTYFDPLGPVENNEINSSISVNVVNSSDPAWQGSNLSVGNVAGVFAGLMNQGRIPKDGNGVYMLLTSGEINAPGLCTQFCGYHSYFSFVADPSVHYKFALIPNVGPRCPNNCALFNTVISPNNNVGADIMASVIAHEYEESTSDPDLNAWYDRLDGCENGDKCAYTYGARYTAPNGSQANMHLGARDYLIQENWPSNGVGGACRQSLP